MRKMKRKNKIKDTRKRMLLIILAIIISIIMIMITNSSKEKKTPVFEEETVETFSSSSEKKQEKNNVIIVEKKPQINSKVTDWNLILVNKENKIPKDYPLELKEIEYGNKVDVRIVEAINRMLSDARKEGLNPYICSSYRTKSAQITLFNNKADEYKRQGYSLQEAEDLASYWVAYPRTSEHEIGLALDIVSKNFQVLDERQESTLVQKWLIEHCNEYGFILRYPTNKKEITKINYEPWHYRYVGVENAKFMTEKGYCLEEYIEYLKKY